jgi:hypothetical protein
MKLGTEDKKKTAIAGVLLVLAIVLVVRALMGGGNSASPSAPTNTSPRPTSTASRSSTQTGRKPARPLLAQTLDPTLRVDLLKSSEDVTYKGTGRDIFRSQPEPQPIPKPVTPDVQPGPPPPPPPPPIDLKFYGFASRKDGYKRIFLSRGEDIFVAKEGDVVDRRYKIVRIGQNSVDVEDMLTNNRQTLPLQAG